jgi:hypothetical protein
MEHLGFTQGQAIARQVAPKGSGQHLVIDGVEVPAHAHEALQTMNP